MNGVKGVKYLLIDTKHKFVRIRTFLFLREQRHMFFEKTCLRKSLKRGRKGRATTRNKYCTEEILH